MASKLKRYADGQGNHLGWLFFCPGCKKRHAPSTGWTFNGDFEKPTFSPSILVTGVNMPEEDPATGDYRRGEDGEYLKDAEGKLLGWTPMQCHSFVRDGMIQFLGDCTHSLVGQTVPLPDYFDAIGDED
jgi:hypothetical protein